MSWIILHLCYCVSLGTTYLSRQSVFVCDKNATTFPWTSLAASRCERAFQEISGWMCFLEVGVLPVCASPCLSVLFIRSNKGWVHRKPCKALLWVKTAMWPRGWLILLESHGVKLFVGLAEVQEIQTTLLLRNFGPWTETDFVKSWEICAAPNFLL